MIQRLKNYLLVTLGTPRTEIHNTTDKDHTVVIKYKPSFLSELFVTSAEQHGYIAAGQTWMKVIHRRLNVTSIVFADGERGQGYYSKDQRGFLRLSIVLKLRIVEDENKNLKIVRDYENKTFNPLWVPILIIFFILILLLRLLIG